jgi:hypothetical protein
MRAIPFWLIPNVLSLDAPMVAVAWQGLLAETTGTPLRFAGRVILFLTVWLIYIVDRLLDARRPAMAEEPARHRFYRRHTRAATVLAMAIFAVDVRLILFEILPGVFRTGLLTFGAVCLYLLFVHATRLTFPKEVVVALLFTAGTFLVAFARSIGSGWQLLPAASAFFLLCLANLVAIEHGESASGLVLGRWFLVWVPVLAVVCPLVFPGAWSGAIAVAAAGLVLIHALGNRLSLEVRRVLLDAALLIPALLFL